MLNLVIRNFLIIAIVIKRLRNVSVLPSFGHQHSEFREQLKYSHYIKKWESDLVIVEPGNSYEPTLALSTKWASRFDSLLLEEKTLHLGLLHFPYGNQPADRKDALTSWTNKGTFANRKSYLSQSAMEPPIGGKQGLKTFHYTCGLGKFKVTNDN